MPSCSPPPCSVMCVCQQCWSPTVVARRHAETCGRPRATTAQRVGRPNSNVCGKIWVDLRQTRPDLTNVGRCLIHICLILAGRQILFICATYLLRLALLICCAGSRERSDAHVRANLKLESSQMFMRPLMMSLFGGRDPELESGGPARGLAVLPRNAAYRLADILGRGGQKWRSDGLRILCEPIFRGTLLRALLAEELHLPGRGRPWHALEAATWGEGRHTCTAPCWVGSSWRF